MKGPGERFERSRGVADLRKQTDMPDRTCVIIENGVTCGKPVVGREMCRKHYTRWSRHGDPLHGANRLPPGTAGVYSITCLVNGRVYIGSSASVLQRWTTHKSWLRNGRHNVLQLQADWDQFGEDAFLFDLAAFAETADERYAVEQAYLDEVFKSGRCYNPSPAAKGSGYTLTDAQRANISAALTGKPKSAEHRANLWRDREVTPEFREQMAANGRAGLGRPKSAETRARMSAAQQARKRELLMKLTVEDVAQIKRRLLAGEPGRALAREFGVSDPTISQIKNGQRWADVAPAAALVT